MGINKKTRGKLCYYTRHKRVNPVPEQNILTNYGRSARIPQNTVNHRKIDNELGLVVRVRARVMVRVRIRVRVYG